MQNETYQSKSKESHESNERIEIIEANEADDLEKYKWMSLKINYLPCIVKDMENFIEKYISKYNDLIKHIMIRLHKFIKKRQSSKYNSI